jgi:NAD(P)-dependent dehydrogenase (short-subunit alcohol dehydrogenase family)
MSNEELVNLEGKVAVVTGAGSGIGAAVTATLHRLGARVALLARTETTLRDTVENLDSARQFAREYATDVTDETQLQRTRDQILSDFDRVDILVTCAAAPASAKKCEEMSYEEWRSVLSTDLDGVFLSCKVFGAGMVEQRYGRIVNMTSFHTIATYPERTAYNAAKSGVEGLTRALAVEWGPYGITVNAVAPGPVRTPRTSWFLEQNPTTESGMLGRTPNHRLGETGDVAGLVAFLVSDAAIHINGQQIVIDGGWTKSAWWGSYEQT